MKTQTNKGFSLIELIVYIALSTIILFAIASFITMIFKWRAKNQVISEVEQQGVYVMRTITRAIRNAEGINSPTQGNSGATLSLDVVDTNNDPTIFDVSADVIRIKEGGASPIDLTNSRVAVSNFSVENLTSTGTPGVIKAQFTLSYINPSGRSEYNYSKVFYGGGSLR